jgi:serine/threonine protein phosphatase PrpC
MSLIVATGHATETGKRLCNEDFVGMVTPQEPELSTKGLIAAIADGVSGNEGGRQASEYTVRGLLADYYATPETWPVTQCLDCVIKAINSWVQQQGSIRPELAGMATTLTTVILRGNFYYFAHIGDTRLYLLREAAMTRLTSDHVWDRPEMQHVLTRAVGLDSRIAIDHGMGELQAHDVLLLVTDGVWSALSEYDMTALLADLHCGKQPQAVAEAMVAAALAAGSSDNASALILRVEHLPQENLRDALSASRQLPLPPKLKVGQVFEGFQVDAILHASQATMVYRVIDLETRRKLVLKTLHPDRANDEEECAAFAHEEWLAKRVVARFFPQVITSQKKHYLYYLSTWHEGASLQQHLDRGRHFTIPDMIAYGTTLVRAIGALHRRSIIHRDIKPGNVHLGEDGQLRVLDFGVARSGLEEHDPVQSPQAGTPSFLAPEQFEQAPASPQTDLYAAGVTLYLVLTRHYPYGEIEPFQRPRFGEPIPPSRYRPDTPHWLENVLLKAVARDPAVRFETAEEFLLALDRGASRPLPAPARMPLVERDPLLLWRMAAIFSIVFNLLLLYLLIVR